MTFVRGRRLGAAQAGALAFATCLLIAGGAMASLRIASKFGRSGTVQLGSGKIMALAPEPGGVVAVGYAGGRMLVTRIAAGGRVLWRNTSAPGIANAVAVQRGGKIVVAGTTAPNGHTSQGGDMVVERLNANGSRDRRFGQGGMAHLRGAVANGLAIAPNGAIVLGGSIPGSDGSPRVALARVKGNGKPDTSLGQGGVAVIDLGQFSEANAVAVQRNGKIVFAGDTGIQVVTAIVGRVTSGGRPDGGFGHSGTYTYGHPRGGGASSFEAVRVDGAGRILAAGGDEESSGQHALFVRLGPGGTPDRSFGGGAVTTPSAQSVPSGPMVGVRALAFGRGGEILAAGVFQIGAQDLGAIWSLKPGGALDGRQGPGGLVKRAPAGGTGATWQAIAVSGGQVFVGGATAASTAFGQQDQALVSRYTLR